ncbi:hypothetical protein [Polaribacter sp. M15]
MNLKKIALLIVVVVLYASCASSYQTINPQTVNYLSKSEDQGVKLEYKYELLNKKYKKKELAKGVRLIAIKITNNSANDLVFGENVTLNYDNGSAIYVMDNDRVFTSLKQSPASYLWYLLLTPTNLYTTETENGYQTQNTVFPIGLILGPGLTAGNMTAASTANKKFKSDLIRYNLNGLTIKQGQTVSGLIGIRSDDYNAINIKVN